MATGSGGAGGGGFNFRLARAYVEIDVDLSRFTAGLVRVQQMLAAVGARGALAGGGLGAVRAPAQAATGALGLMAVAANSLKTKLAALAVTYVSFKSLVGLGRLGAGLESATVALQRVTGLSASAAAGMADSLRRMSLELAGVPMERIFDIAGLGARLGIAGGDLEMFTRNMARMSQVLADIPTDEAATRITRLLAVFQRGPQDALRLASALNQLDMASTASARDILDITSRLSGPASFLGMKPQQALALATALREAGVPLETGGTAMTQIMTRMASQKDSAKFARTAGMATRQFEAVLGTDPLRAIKAFEEGLARIDRAQGPIAAVRVLDELHLDGQRVRGTLLQLGRVMEQLNRYEAIAGEEWESTSSIMGGAAMVTNTLTAQTVRMINTFKALAQDLGLALAPAFKGAIEAVRMLMEDMRAWLAANRETVSAVAKGYAYFFTIVADLPRNIGLIYRIIGTYRQDFIERLAMALKAFVINTTYMLLFLRDFARDLFQNILIGVGNFAIGAAMVITTTFSSILSNLSARVFNALADLKGLIGAVPGLARVLAGVPGVDRLVGALPAKRMDVPAVDFGLAAIAPGALLAGMKKLPGFAAFLKGMPGIDWGMLQDRGPERAMLWQLLGPGNRRQRDLALAGLALVRERLSRAFAGGAAEAPAERVLTARERLVEVRAARVRAAESFAGRRLFAGPPPAWNPLLVSPEAAAAATAARSAAASRSATARHARAESMVAARVARREAAEHAAARARFVGPPSPGAETLGRRATLAERLDLNRRMRARRVFDALLAGPRGPRDRLRELALAFRPGGDIAPGTPGPIAARIARARARRHARDRPGALAAGLVAFGNRIRRLGVVDPVAAAKAVAEAKKREENAAFARMIGEAVAVAFGVKGGNALQQFGDVLRQVGALQ